MVVLELNEFGFTYAEGNRPALAGVSLRLHRSEILGLLGPSEAGKSSLCLSVGGFIPRFYKGKIKGQYSLLGKNALDYSMASVTDRVGLVFQNPYNQLSGAKFSVAEEIAFGLENQGMGRREMQQRIEEVMVELKLTDLASRNPFNLSGGQVQRVALAGIMAMRPEVLVLDEPTSQLDTQGRIEIISIIKRYARQGGAVLIAEQNLEVLIDSADRLALMFEGSIVNEGGMTQVARVIDPVENGVKEMRYTTAARLGRGSGLWPADAPLPITLEDAAKGFGHDGP